MQDRFVCLIDADGRAYPVKSSYAFCYHSDRTVQPKGYVVNYHFGLANLLSDPHTGLFIELNGGGIGLGTVRTCTVLDHEQL